MRARDLMSSNLRTRRRGLLDIPRRVSSDAGARGRNAVKRSLDEGREVVRNWQHRIINVISDLDSAVDARRTGLFADGGVSRQERKGA
jgi:hypothetical protein